MSTVLLPDASRARKLKKSLDLSLLQSLEYLTGVAAKGLDLSLEHLDRILESLRRSRLSDECRLSAFAFAYHDQLRRALGEQDAHGVRALLDWFADISWTCRRPTMTTFGSEQYSKPNWIVLERTLAATYNEEYEICWDAQIPSSRDATPQLLELISAINALQLIDAEAHGEFQELVSDILMIASRNISQGTCFNTLGCIYLSHEARSQIDFLDIVVHELTHLLLYSYWTSDILIENDRAELFSSPFRTEKRPLSGIFHAACVLARTIYTLRRVESHYRAIDMTTYIDPQSWGKKLAALEEDFAESYQIIITHARLTALGSRIINEAANSVG